MERCGFVMILKGFSYRLRIKIKSVWLLTSIKKITLKVGVCERLKEHSYWLVIWNWNRLKKLFSKTIQYHLRKTLIIKFVQFHTIIFYDFELNFIWYAPQSKIKLTTNNNWSKKTHQERLPQTKNSLWNLGTGNINTESEKQYL